MSLLCFRFFFSILLDRLSIHIALQDHFEMTSFVDQVMGEYGYSIEHILMVDIIPDDAVRKAMNEINAGEYFNSA